MRFMERNCLSEIPLAPPEILGCANELTRSNLDALALTAENCEDVLRRSANATPDDCRPWTNDKHNLYLNHLEMSYIEQLHQSMGLLVQCSKKNEIDKNVSQKQPANVHTASEQFTVLRSGYCQKVDNERGVPFSHTYADSHNPLTGPWIDNYRRIRGHCPPPSADMQEFLKLCGAKKPMNGKGIVSRGLATCSEQFSASNPYKEGMGQNFVNEDNISKSNNKSQAKRLKTAVAESSGYDQIIPSRKRRRTDNSAVNNRSNLAGEELPRHENVSENFETFGSPPI